MGGVETLQKLNAAGKVKFDKGVLIFDRGVFSKDTLTHIPEDLRKWLNDYKILPINEDDELVCLEARKGGKGYKKAGEEKLNEHLKSMEGFGNALEAKAGKADKGNAASVEGGNNLRRRLSQAERLLGIRSLQWVG